MEVKVTRLGKEIVGKYAILKRTVEEKLTVEELVNRKQTLDMQKAMLEKQCQSILAQITEIQAQITETEECIIDLTGGEKHE